MSNKKINLRLNVKTHENIDEDKDEMNSVVFAHRFLLGYNIGT